MALRGHFNPVEIAPDSTFVDKGGLKRTAANQGMLFCDNASRLFSLKYGMVSVTLRPAQDITGGVYAPLADKDMAATTDMVLWAANMGEHYITRPGMYASLTPSGIEFTIWTASGKHTLVDNTTAVDAGNDVILSFVWDSSGRLYGGRWSMVIIADGGVTAAAAVPIAVEDLNRLYVIGTIPPHPEESSSVSEDEVVVHANFVLGDSLSGKNGLNDITIRRIEICRFPVGIDVSAEHGSLELQPLVSPVHAANDLPFTVEGARWMELTIGEPVFGPATDVQVDLLDTGTTRSSQSNGEDVGRETDDSYPEAPDGLPPGIEEVKRL
jgi:hypothetical protein